MTTYTLHIFLSWLGYHYKSVEVEDECGKVVAVVCHFGDHYHCKCDGSLIACKIRRQNIMLF